MVSEIALAVVWMHGYLFFLDFAAVGILAIFLVPKLIKEWRQPHVDLALGLVIYIAGHTVERAAQWAGSVMWGGIATAATAIGLMCCVRMFAASMWGWQAWLWASVAAAVLSAVITFG